MDILQYLIELLKIRKEIGIEGLGTLYKKKTPGRYDAELHSFIPPSYVLEFTNDVKEHFNLTQYIQSKRSISEESAEYFINDFVEKVKKSLAEAGTYDLENLGRFSFENEQLTFHPTHDINIGFDFFALPSFTGELTPTPTTANTHFDSSKPTASEVEEVVIDSREQGEETENIAAANFEDEEVPLVEEVGEAANEIHLAEDSIHEESPIAATDDEVEEVPLVEEPDEATNEVHIAEEETGSEDVEAENSNHEESPVAAADEEVEEIPLVEEPDEASNEVHLAEEETGSEDVESADSNHEESEVATTLEEAEENDAEPNVEHEDTNELGNEETAFETTHTALVDVQSEEEEITEIANTTKSIEENEATQDEVYEEIAEVNGYTEVSKNTVEDTETWDFDDEHVISPEDIQEEKLPLAEDDDEEDQNVKNDDKKIQQGIKIKVATNRWDFDNEADTENSLNKNETGEFDGIDEPEEFEEEVTVMSLYKKLTIGVLTIGLIIAAVYLYNPELINSLTKTEAISPDQKMAIPLPQNNLKTQKDSLSFADSIMENAEKAGLAVEPAKDTLKVTANAKPLNTTTYEIIAAALGTSKEVEKYIATMKKNGFDAKVANMPGKIYKKISIASYSNRDSATKDLKKLKVRLKNSDLYIFEDKNK